MKNGPVCAVWSISLTYHIKSRPDHPNTVCTAAKQPHWNTLTYIIQRYWRLLTRTHQSKKADTYVTCQVLTPALLPGQHGRHLRREKTNLRVIVLMPVHEWAESRMPYKGPFTSIRHACYNKQHCSDQIIQCLPPAPLCLHACHSVGHAHKHSCQ